ncbi:lasso peptide biosynthesis PqqD family chaperone [Ferviditalea candida]|uniref:Lasso peptide biosynthesis PqqD family chaperone n=1 Tax=Ferviditalea candida TaxID=3108399 RepID=A0ABU5ZE40_9BACL|nr:lasso peptide biosynthesis PqqD family chaperone [Paenibacillaceae bacterium T2]
MIKDIDILPDEFIIQSKGNIISDMDGEKVMLNVQKGKYYNLGEIGGVIWDLLEQPVSANQVIAELMAQYEVEQSECEEQVLAFLKLLFDEGLIEIGEKVGE